MKKHWIKHLEEVGRPMERKANSITTLYDEIKMKLTEIAAIQKRIKEEEADAEETALSDWTKEEIQIAKNKGDDLNPIRFNREDFMEFFRSDDYADLLSSDDCIEVFQGSIKGSSDLNVKVLLDILCDYQASHIFITHDKIVFIEDENVVRDASEQVIDIFSTKLPDEIAKQVGRTHMEKKAVDKIITLFNRKDLAVLDTYLLNEPMISQEEREIIIEALFLYQSNERK